MYLSLDDFHRNVDGEGYGRGSGNGYTDGRGYGNGHGSSDGDGFGNGFGSGNTTPLSFHHLLVKETVCT